MRTTVMLLSILTLACMSGGEATAPEMAVAPTAADDSVAAEVPAMGMGGPEPRPAADILMDLEHAAAPAVAFTEPECTEVEEKIDGVCVSKAKLEEMKAKYAVPDDEDEEIPDEQVQQQQQHQEQHQLVIVQSAKVDMMHAKVDETEDKLEAILDEIDRRQEQGEPLLTPEEKEALKAELEEIERVQEQLQQQAAE